MYHICTVQEQGRNNKCSMEHGHNNNNIKLTCMHCV